MLDYLEFNGIDDQFRSLVDKYTDSYDNSANVIITRENGEVVFSLNDAYMPHKERFIAVVKAGTAIILLMFTSWTRKIKSGMP